MFEWKLKAQNIFLDENTGGKGRYFKARILQPGLVKYSFGVCLLEKETIDKFINEFVGCPVIIGHNDVTTENADKLVGGHICHIWYDNADGWYWVDGIIDDQDALNKIDDGWNVSCQYEITEYSNNTDGKLHNGNPYDKVILNGKPEHLAIVETPRYENAMIAVNALDLTAENARGFGGEEGDWITVNGVHIFVKKGQSKDEAVKDFIEKQQGTKPKQEEKQSDKKKDKKADKDFSGMPKHETVKEQKLEDGISEITDKYGRTTFKKGNKWADVMKNGTYYFAAYGLTHKTGVSWEDEKGVTHDQLLHGKGFKTEKGARKWALEQLKRLTSSNDINIAKNSIIEAINEIKDTDMFNKLFNRKKEFEMNKDELKEIFADCLQEVLLAKNEEEKEDELKKAADNEEDEEEDKKAENKCKNEDVDKRDIIRQIMAIAGKEEASEDVKTIAKLAEKLAYDKSEAGTADNGKKAKCEDEEEDKEDKEEAKNKAKNAIDDMKGLFTQSSVKRTSNYVTQSDAIDLGNQLF